ncbi:MAG: choice-of-anchor B family protein [Phycisphaerae bacterium]
MSKQKRAALICSLAVTVLTASSWAHDDAEFQADRQPPYNGPGWRAANGGVPPIVFAQQGVNLMSWIPLVEFDPTVTSADDCWGYVSPSGREYALIGLSIGTGIVEVTDPANAQILTVMPGPNSIWRDIKFYQQFAYAVSEGGDGIQVFDLSQIDAGLVTQVNTITSGGTTATHNVAINTQSGFLYRVGGGSAPLKGLRIYSLANPQSPAFVGEWSQRYFHDAQIVNWTQPPFAGREIAFCFAGDTSGGGNPGLDILDVTDKANITQVGSINLSLPPIFSHPALFSHQGWLSVDRRYVYLNDEVDEGSLGTTTTTRVIDIADLTAPVQVAIFTNGNSARDHNLYTVDNLVFEANYRSGLRVYDAFDPLAPVEIAHFDTYPPDDNANYNGLWNVYPYLPSRVVLGSDIEKGLFVWTVDAFAGPPVPTVSAWGMGLMMLLLAVAGAMVLRRRRPVQTS